jgi:HAD superfamily hydrolase (TIGR01662 family)
MNYKKYLNFWIHVFTKKERIITSQEKSVFDIDFARLTKDINLIIFDFDDTLVDFLGELKQDSLDLLNKLKQEGFEIAIFSNCTKKRFKELESMVSKLDVFLVTKRDKPSPDGFLQAVENFNTSPQKTVAIGDKIGTEMYGAFLAGIDKRILVEPYSYILGGKKANIFHRFVRKVEKLFYFQLFKNEGKQNTNK